MAICQCPLFRTAVDREESRCSEGLGWSPYFYLYSRAPNCRLSPYPAPNCRLSPCLAPNCRFSPYLAPYFSLYWFPFRSTSAVSCAQFHTSCGDSLECFPNTYACDGVQHCTNGFDENNCEQRVKSRFIGVHRGLNQD